MNRCPAIKPNGERCKGRAIEGSEWCWNHDPAHKDAHRRHGSRGGKRGGRGRPQAEISDVKQRLSDLADDVVRGNVERGTGAVVSQILNVYLRAISVELKVREVTELDERLEELERVLEQRRGGNRWGA